jgi:hypothetical protein
MRTTIRLDDALLAQAKQLALQSGRTLTSVIENALREALARQRQAYKRTPVHFTTVDGNGLLPGVDLDDSASLLDLMEASDAAH